MIPLLLAADEVDATAGGWVRFLPLALMCTLFVWLFWMLKRSVRNVKPLQDRSLAHMETLEARTEEMVTLLREIRDKLRAD